MRKQNHWGRGFSITELVVSLGILTIIATGILFLKQYTFNATNSSMVEDEIVVLRQKIATYIDCDQTLASAGIDPNNITAGDCGSTSGSPSGQVAPFLRLHKRHPNGGSSPLTGPLAADGSAEVGRLQVWTSCSESESSLVIRAQPKHGDGSHHSLSRLLFGGAAGALPLCLSSSETSDPDSPTNSSGTSDPDSPTNFTCSGGQTVGGYCWYLSNYGDNCDSVCSANSGVYDEATRTYAGSDGNLSNCYSVMAAIATPLGPASSANLSNPCGADCAVGCVTNPSNFVWRYHGGVPTNSTADWPNAPGPFNRACACKSP